MVELPLILSGNFSKENAVFSPILPHAKGEPVIETLADDFLTHRQG